MCYVEVWQMFDACGTYLESSVYAFRTFGSAISIFEKTAKQSLKNRPFTCKIGTKQACISPIIPKWGKKKRF